MEKNWIKRAGKGLMVNSSRIYLLQFAERAAASVSQGAMVLDAGAGTCPYQELFQYAVYESADFCKVDKEYSPITYSCDLTSIPVATARYDLVLCSQVLEHVSEPEQVLKELFRVLKPGGTLWISAPLCYEEHERPYDFYRYTSFGFRYLLEKVGFCIQEMEWLEGYCGTLSYHLGVAALSLPVHPRSYGGGIVGIGGSIMSVICRPMFVLLSAMYARFDIRHRITDTGFCKNYAIVAKKPVIVD